MANIITTSIPDYATSWENYAGSSVEQFIKERLQGSCGYIYRSASKVGDYYYLYGFNCVEDYNTWLEEPSSITPLFTIALPNLEDDVYSANLYTNSNTTKLVNLGDGIVLNLRYTSTKTDPTSGTTSDTYNSGTLIIERSVNGGSYSTVASIEIEPIEYEQTTEYTEVDITDYLADGDNALRIHVIDNTTQAISSYIKFASVVNTTLQVVNATDTTQPLTSSIFYYYIQGIVAKTLNLIVTQNGSSSTYSFSVGTNTYTETPYSVDLQTEFNAGTVEVEAYLSVDDTTLTSDHITNEFYYSDGQDTDTAIILNSKSTEITNYDNVHFFDYTIYNNQEDVHITLTDTNSNVYLDYTVQNVQPNTQYSFYNVLQIDSTLTSINGLVTVTAGNATTSYGVVIDNSDNYNPTQGANFILNVQTRNNSEEDPATIQNIANNTLAESSFEGFNFVNDGWLSDDDGYKVLRVPANRHISISYDPLDSITSSNGTTIELDYKVYNVFVDDQEMLSFKSMTQDNTATLGFVMNSTEATFYTTNNQTKRDQDVVFQEDTRTHMAINIIPNLSNSGLNYIRIFINGVLNREMLYTNTDIFKNGTVTIEIGSSSNDIDIYGMRIYKSSLSASDIRQDYLSTIPELEDKQLFKQANNILSSDNTISYDLASEKYNTLVWTGSIPSYSTGDVNYRGTLEINIIDDLDHSGTITNLRVKGQGSSSKTYWKWNQQYDWNKYDDDTVWTDGYGQEHTDGYSLTDDDPAAKKLVAKLNWASPQQSHKQGSTALYNDLWKQIIGGNSITQTEGYEDCRNAVHEKQFMFFVKSSPTATPVFYGLMTFGSGKYDKPTFGYNSDVFPNYLIIEGSDNGMPLASRQVPWFTDEVTYNANEEYYEYANAGNIDYGMGNRDNISYFINAFNFAYLHSTRLSYYTNDDELDNADKTYQYWNTSTYNVVRYDYISQSWVNAAATKTNSEYDVLNIQTQTSITPTGDNDVDNQSFIDWRIAHFKTNVSTYYNVNDVLYSMAFLKLIAASDNRCKNTYEYLDPITFKICLAQDDMDTIFLTDNVGRKTKPYYVEEHDTYINASDTSAYYFNGEDNVFFSLMDQAYDAELRNMMKTIFDTMNSEEFGGSAEQCFENYFYYIQEYFPAVAYNETARLLYENASIAQASGDYQNGTPAISQSLGDQLQAEKQFMKRRLPYLQSWAAATPFYVGSSNSLNFRSVLTSQSQQPTYEFTLTPWQWLYPKAGVGQTINNDNTRVQAGTEYTTQSFTTDGNTNTFIYGANYYTSYGEFGDKSIGETFNLTGNRLLEFSADINNVETYEFKPTAMTIACPVLEYLSLNGCSTLLGSLDLSNMTKLEEINLTDTGLSSVTLPETGYLANLYLPAGLTTLILNNCDNIEILQVQGYTNLLYVETDNSKLAKLVLSNATNTNATYTFNNIDVEIDNDIQAGNAVNLLINCSNITCTGHINLGNYEITAPAKAVLQSIYGNIDNAENSLYIEYSHITDDNLSISGDNQIGQGKVKSFTAVYDGNDVYQYDWTIVSGSGRITAQNWGTCYILADTDSAEDIVLSLTIHRVSDAAMTATKTINVVENIHITSIDINNQILSTTGTETVNIVYTPSNYTVSPLTINCSISDDTYCSISDYSLGDGTITLNYHTQVTDTIQTATVSVEIVDTDDRTISTTFDVYLTNPITALQIDRITIWTRE